MKKFLVLIVFAMIIIFALSCGNEKKSSGYELALITDVGTIDDRSFNQGSWEGLKKYAEEKRSNKSDQDRDLHRKSHRRKRSDGFCKDKRGYSEGKDL